ncbi:MAG: VWA domain-containing protein [Bryobacteraceae bacterium]
MLYIHKLAPALLLAGTLALQAQQPTKSVVLNVVAMDSAGNPVQNLTASDLAVFDNGSRQTIQSLSLNRSAASRPVVILFDLLNSNLDARGAIWDAMKTSLAHLPETGPFYLYLIEEDGSLYAVHAVDAPAGAAWLRNIKPLLDKAMQATLQLKPADFKGTSVIGLPARFNATVKALDEMRARMEVLHGPKDLLWVTYGFPSHIQLVGIGWWDGSPILRELGARFVLSGITVYTADPGISLTHGILNRDALDVLSDATGGRAFATINLDQALAKAEADAQTTYSLQFQPPARTWDGKYHKVKVTVVRKGVHLQTQHGYFALPS